MGKIGVSGKEKLKLLPFIDILVVLYLIVPLKEDSWKISSL
jgi:hypothetical protein